jgi:hypothetical protein
MTTLISPTPHPHDPGGLDQTSNRPSINGNVLMSTADTEHLFGKIWIAQKQGLPIVNTFH